MRRLWTLFGCVLAGWVVLLSSSCHMPRYATQPSADSTSAIYVVRHGWHAGIAVRRADLLPGRLPALPAMAEDAPMLEVGWGEASYYPATDPGFGTLLKAGLWPTGSVLHVVPVRGAVSERFPNNTVIRIPVGLGELDALATFLAGSFAPDSARRAVRVAEGYYPGSHFYRSRLRYHAFQNCNHWAAEALEAAGCRTARWRTLTVGRLLAQAERCGTRIQ